MAILNQEDLIAKTIGDYERTIVKIILLCIDNLEFGLGTTKITQILRGSQTKFITDYGLQNNVSFSLLKQFSKNDMKYILNLMVETEYLDAKDYKFGTAGILKVGAKGYSLLEEDNELEFSFIDAITSSDFIELDDKGQIVYEALRKLRFKIATQNERPAFVICSEVQLINIADKLPVTKEEFLAIKGIGDSFIEKYYDEFSNEIKKYIDG